MKRPSVEEVREYCESRCNGIDAQAWMDYYESVGWKIGKKPMVSWQACVRTWERNQKPKQHVLDKHLSRSWAD